MSDQTEPTIPEMLLWLAGAEKLVNEHYEGPHKDWVGAIRAILEAEKDRHRSGNLAYFQCPTCGQQHLIGITK